MNKNIATQKLDIIQSLYSTIHKLGASLKVSFHTLFAAVNLLSLGACYNEIIFSSFANLSDKGIDHCILNHTQQLQTKFTN